MNFHNLRRLLLLNAFFDLEYMVKTGLMSFDLNSLITFYELSSSIRLKDLIYVQDIKCFGNNVVNVNMMYSKKSYNSIPFSSREEALEYMECLTFFINLLSVHPNKS